MSFRKLLIQVFPTYFNLLSGSDTCNNDDVAITKKIASDTRDLNQALARVLEASDEIATGDLGETDGHRNQRHRDPPGPRRVLH